MKRITLTVLLSINCFLAFAQEKTGVGILPFTYVQGGANYQDVVSIQEAVTNAFVKTKRFDIVDRSKMDELKKEKELQKTEDFIDGKVIAQGGNLGAQFLISGHVVSAIATEERGDSGSMGFKAKLSIVLKVIDVSTGQVTKSETIQPKGGSLLGQLSGTAPKTAQGAISKAIQDIESKVDEFVSINFPVSFDIVEINEVDGGGNAKKILSAGGSDFGLKKGEKLIVVEIMEIEVSGKKMNRKKNIGELKIEKVEDENFSICSVKNGGVEINSKFVAKAKLKVITQE